MPVQALGLVALLLATWVGSDSVVAGHPQTSYPKPKSRNPKNP